MIKIIVTGGTIDKQYDPVDGNLVFPETQLSDMLKQARCTVPVSIQQLMLKDSLDMTDHDREQIQQACINSKQDKIIISHGTDSMVQSAQLLAATVPDKTIILFGAMIPYSFAYSDALFNLGNAIAAVQSLDKGVFITMNGKIFNSNNVQKIREQGLFQTLQY